MKYIIYSNNLGDYVKLDSIIDYDNGLIKDLSDSLYEKSNGVIDYIKNCFTYVRDNIKHSNDYGINDVTCKASEVLERGHGICFAKSHLLAALLRSKGIPCGFSYQKLILDDDLNPILIYHGLNGVYISELDKWIRLDARGNKEGVDAQFSLDEEKLAFPIRTNLGEVDNYTIYPNPDKNVIFALTNNKTRFELWANLPQELDK